jgi:hypothetical protein
MLRVEPGPSDVSSPSLSLERRRDDEGNSTQVLESKGFGERPNFAQKPPPGERSRFFRPAKDFLSR